MKTRTFTVALAALLVLGMTGVTAYTTATADRDVSVDVADDDQAVIDLEPGEGSSVTSGTLTVDADNEDLNREAKFVYGDTANPTSSFNFNMTNSDDVTHSYEISEDVAADNVYFEFYRSDGTIAGTTNGGPANFDVSSGETVYVVLVVEKTGTTTGDDAISGTVTIDAE